MFIELFDETLNLLGEVTPENIMTALMKVNSTFINSIDLDSDDMIDEDLANDALAFTAYFLENYGEETFDIRDLCFNGEPGIIDFTELAISTSVKEKILMKANANFSKKNEFDMNKLKKHLLNLMNEYEDIVLETYGTFEIDDGSIDLTSEFELEELDENIDNLIKMSLFAENAKFFIQCGNYEDSMVVYGVEFQNNTWNIIDVDLLKEIMDDDWLEEQASYGYTTITFDKLKDKI